MNGKAGEMRPSQLITTFGPGAIMDLPDLSVIIAGTDNWDTDLCRKIPEPRLERKLRIRKILSPPFPKRDGGHQGTLPAFQFPEYLVCPGCRKLAPVDQFYTDKDIAYCQCEKINPPRAFPARFIQACSKGHIDDFPWHNFVHGKKKNYDCPGTALRLNDKGATGSIADVEVECKVCRERRTLEDAFKGMSVGRCTGRRPWLGPRNRERCSENARALLRGASNIYFPVINSALVIPPYNNPLYITVSNNLDRLAKINSVEKLKVYIEDGVFPDFEGYDPEDVWRAIQNFNEIMEGPEQDLLYPEWEAILRGSQPDGEYDFETEVSAVPSQYSQYLSNLIMVRRLAEVRVLQGFTRIDPPPDTTAMITQDEETEIISSRTPLSNRYLGWLPGILTRGEGIFLTLNGRTLKSWEERTLEAGERMAEAYRQFCKDRQLPPETAGPFPGVRYVLLHTLAHALMRQLCLTSGYSSTALRERIYSRKKEGQNMAGILIYTATPDSEGSLGGLMELGKTEKFRETLWKTLQDALFCSGDPLCAEHEPESLGDLNGASCHACLLASETSCEKSNRFLDRSFLVPTVSKSHLAYFGRE